MLRLLSKFFIWVTGWKIGGIYPLPKEVREKCVVIAVPHTTNWDLPYTIAFMAMLQVKIRYTIKKEWIFFPMNLILSPLGAIPIDRTPKVKGQERLSTTEAMIKLFDENDKLALVIPPEGTRSLRTEWKTGFYHTALGAKVPIVLGFLDFKKKEGGVLGVIYPTGDLDADMRLIIKHYQGVQGKYPELFSFDKRYV